MRRRNYPLGPYGLGIVLFLLAVGAMALQWHFTWDSLVAEAAHAGEDTPTFYLIWSTYWANVWENLQSEWWQLFSFVVLTTYLVYRHSHESRDSMDAFEADVHQRLDNISRRLDAIQNSLNTPQDRR